MQKSMLVDKEGASNFFGVCEQKHVDDSYVWAASNFLVTLHTVVIFEAFGTHFHFDTHEIVIDK